MNPQIFLDLDGVLSDFDGHYEALFEVRPNQDTYDPPDFWDRIREHGRFFRTQPMMKDAMVLWNAVKHLRPIILTGIPRSIPHVGHQKRQWVDEHLGRDVQVYCCPSKDKCKWGKPGDILVDDRIKYSGYWIEMGGVFIHHTSALTSIAALAVRVAGAFELPSGLVELRETRG